MGDFMNTLRLKTSIAAIAAALSFTMTAPAYADDSADFQFNDASYDTGSDSQESDDIYAVLNPSADRQATPWGPGRGGGHGPGHGGGHGPGYPPPPGHGGGGWGPGHGGGGGHYRGVQCRAVNRRGIAFYGQGRNMPEARDAAMRRCYNVSRSCYMDGCQPL